MPISWANAISNLNRSQLKKRNIRKLKDVLQDNSEKTVKIFKKVSQSDMKRIKAKIQQQANDRKKREKMLDIVLCTIVVFVTIYLSWQILN